MRSAILVAIWVLGCWTGCSLPSAASAAALEDIDALAQCEELALLYESALEKIDAVVAENALLRAENEVCRNNEGGTSLSRRLLTTNAMLPTRYLVTAITSTADLQTAVAAWCSNSTSATTTYGDI